MNAVVETPATSTELTVASPYMRTIDMMLQRGAEIGSLERLFDLQIAWEANEARKAYMAALARMKAEIPIEIFKRKKVDVPGGAKFKHAELADVVDACCAAMGKFGFVHRWIPRQEEGAIVVKCIVTHERGHSEDCELRAAPDDSGKKNAIQMVGSTVTYLERYTLQAILGVAAKNMDDDGNAAGKKAEPVVDPDGFENWKADMKAIADEGMQKLTDTWSKSDAGFRRHVIKHYDSWWDEMKAKAVQADKKAKQS
jgi:hypothetical protein